MAAERALLRSRIGIAIGYADAIWSGLVRLLGDPLALLDNNKTDRGMRGLDIGRTNHHGSRSERGLELAALVYTNRVGEACQHRPAAYLRESTVRAIANPRTATLPNVPHSGCSPRSDQSSIAGSAIQSPLLPRQCLMGTASTYGV